MNTITLGSKATTSYTCTNCQRSIPAGKQYTYRGKNNTDIHLCNDCTGLVKDQFLQATKNINYLGAFFGGLIAAIVAGIIWFAVAVITGYEIGYVAIGVGYLVALGISKGSGNKRGTKLQIMGMVLTVVAILGAETFLGSYSFDPIGLFIMAFALYIVYSRLKPIRI